MHLSQPIATVFVPDGRPLEEALARTTHLGIAAHPDDLEFMTWHGIQAGLVGQSASFGAVIVTDGKGSPRTHRYESMSDDALQAVRRREQEKAAVAGEYSLLVCLQFSSAAVKVPHCEALWEDLRNILDCTRPEVVYTHNPMDRHDTHVAVGLHTIRALRSLVPANRPISLYGCEVWRSLDWLADGDRRLLNVGGHDHLMNAVMGVFDSQIAGGKRYDLATLGRKRANATYSASHETDTTTAAEIVVDMTPLMQDGGPDVQQFVRGLMERFESDVMGRLERLQGKS